MFPFSHLPLTKRAISRVRAAVHSPMRVRGPVAAQALDEDYRSGRWTYLEGPSELARFAVIAGYVTQLRPNAKILDVGAGAGRLRSFFDHSKFAFYIGTDLSAQAVTRASECRFERTTFVVADLNAGPVGGPYDAVIFSECLQYAADPRQAFESYWSVLTENGLAVVSMFTGAARSKEVWRSIANVRTSAHSATIVNERGITWKIAVFQKIDC